MVAAALCVGGPVGRLPDRLASAQREAWGVGGRGMAAEGRQSLRAVAGAEAKTS